jgi:hypothetical protein
MERQVITAEISRKVGGGSAEPLLTCETFRLLSGFAVVRRNELPGKPTYCKHGGAVQWTL